MYQKNYSFNNIDVTFIAMSFLLKHDNSLTLPHPTGTGIDMNHKWLFPNSHTKPAKQFNLLRLPLLSCLSWKKEEGDLQYLRPNSIFVDSWQVQYQSYWQTILMSLAWALADCNHKSMIAIGRRTNLLIGRTRKRVVGITKLEGGSLVPFKHMDSLSFWFLDVNKIIYSWGNPFQIFDGDNFLLSWQQKYCCEYRYFM